jgi:hypothetical protein
MLSSSFWYFLAASHDFWTFAFAFVVRLTLKFEVSQN